VVCRLNSELIRRAHPWYITWLYIGVLGSRLISKSIDENKHEVFHKNVDPISLQGCRDVEGDIRGTDGPATDASGLRMLESPVIRMT
jgi:hypothetical protein